MNLLKNWTNLIEKARKLDAKSLEAIRYAIIGFLLLDLFGIYWYLELKKLGMALLMVSIVLMFAVILLESNLPRSRREVKNKMEQELEPKKPEEENQSSDSEDKEEKKDKKEEKPEEDEEPEQSSILGEGMGLPDAEEYNKRMEDAIF